MTTDKLPKKRRRSIIFDDDIALQHAMYAFWQFGYEGTSMSTLVSVMKMNKASIYAVYGSKESLFKKTVECYVNGPASFLKASLHQPTALAVVQAMLSQAAFMLADRSHPAGCLLTQCDTLCGAGDSEIKLLLKGYRETFEQKIAERFVRAIKEKDLLPTAEPTVLAKLVMTTHQGMVIQALSGATQTQLFNVAVMATQLIAQAYSVKSGFCDDNAEMRKTV